VEATSETQNAGRMRVGLSCDIFHINNHCVAPLATARVAFRDYASQQQSAEIAIVFFHQTE
jgi:hypothetical protein